VVSDRVKVPCPHPKCDGTLPVPVDLPPGEYDCICGACRVHVHWATRGGMNPKWPLVILMSRRLPETWDGPEPAA
jgi:hypothetical protein